VGSRPGPAGHLGAGYGAGTGLGAGHRRVALPDDGDEAGDDGESSVVEALPLPGLPASRSISLTWVYRHNPGEPEDAMPAALVVAIVRFTG
jgi:hypothetical protein